MLRSQWKKLSHDFILTLLVGHATGQNKLANPRIIRCADITGGDMHADRGNIARRSTGAKSVSDSDTTTTSSLDYLRSKTSPTLKAAESEPKQLDNRVQLIRAAPGLIVRPGIANLQHRKERLLRNIHAAHALHPLLAFLLLLQQFAFAAEMSPP